MTLVERCVNCKAGNGRFAMNGEHFACFYHRIATGFTEIPCTAVSQPPQTALVSGSALPTPVATCWDLYSDKLLVFWAYKLGWWNNYTVQIPFSSQNHFTPSDGGTPPTTFKRSFMVPHKAFVGLSDASECQTWRLGSESLSVCAHDHVVSKCTAGEQVVMSQVPGVGAVQGVHEVRVGAAAGGEYGEEFDYENQCEGLDAVFCVRPCSFCDFDGICVSDSSLCTSQLDGISSGTCFLIEGQTECLEFGCDYSDEGHCEPFDGQKYL